MRWLWFALCACGRVAFDAVPDAPTDVAPSHVPMLRQQIGEQTAATPHTQTLIDAVQAGDLLVVICGSLTPVISVADTQGNTYLPVLNFANPDNGSDGAVFYAIASATGMASVTVTYDGAKTHTTDIFEYAHAGAVDAVTSSHAAGGTTIDTGALHTSQAGDLLLFFTHQDAVTTWTAPAGYVVRADNQHTFVAERIAGDAGSYEAASTSSQPQAWDAHLVAFPPK